MKTKVFIALILLPLTGHAAGKIINADIAPSGTANIALNKLAASTARNVCTFDASGYIAGGVSPSTNKSVLSADGTNWVNTVTYDSTSSASTLVQRDASQNAFANNFVSKSTNVVSAAGTTTLTAASARLQNLTGSTTQTFVLPDATTLGIGSRYEFDNNSTGLLTIQANGGGAIGTVPSGGYGVVKLTANSLAAGVWDLHFWIPGSGTTNQWGTTGLAIGGTLSATGASTLASSTGSVLAGATGSIASYTNPIHLTLPNTSSNANGVVIQGNNADWPASPSSASASAQGFLFLPKDSGGTTKIYIRGSNNQSFLQHYNAFDGTYTGYFSMGLPWGFMNNNSGIVTFKVSGTTGQSVDIQQWSNQSDFGNIVSAVAANGQFKAPAGSTSTASYGLYGTTGIGMYFPSTSSIGWTVGSALQMSLSSSGLSLGVAGTLTGKLLFNGSTSGTVTMQSAAAAGTWTMTLPTTGGTSGFFLQTDGSGTTTWAAASSACVVPVLTKTTDYTIQTSDFTCATKEIMVEMNCTASCTLTNVAASNSGFKVNVINIGTATATVATAGGDTYGSTADTTWVLVPGGSPQSANTFISNGGTRWNGF